MAIVASIATVLASAIIADRAPGGQRVFRAKGVLLQQPGAGSACSPEKVAILRDNLGISGDLAEQLCTAIADPDELERMIRDLIEKGAAYVCANYSIPPVVCQKVADKALEYLGRLIAWGGPTVFPLYNTSIGSSATSYAGTFRRLIEEVGGSYAKTVAKLRPGEYFITAAEFKRAGNTASRVDGQSRSGDELIARVGPNGGIAMRMAALFSKGKRVVDIPSSKLRTWFDPDEYRLPNCRDLDGTLRTAVNYKLRFPGQSLSELLDSGKIISAAVYSG